MGEGGREMSVRREGYGCEEEGIGCGREGREMGVGGREGMEWRVWRREMR